MNGLFEKAANVCKWVENRHAILFARSTRMSGGAGDMVPCLPEAFFLHGRARQPRLKAGLDSSWV